MLLPPALGFSPHPPVSVYGTGTWYTIAAFLGSRNRTLPYLCSVRVTDSDHETDLPVPLLPCLPGALFPGCAVLLRPHSSVIPQYRNLHLLSIGYDSRPRLRPRLTQGRSALPWKPWIFGLKDSHLYLATHSGILSSMQSTAPYGTASFRMQCSSTDPCGSLSFGGTFQPRTFSAQGLSTSELLRTL